MGAIIALVIGLIAGVIAKLVMPGKDSGGVVVTMLLGVAGSFVAYILGSVIGWYTEAGEGPGIIASSIGALVVLGVYRATRGR